MDFYLKQFPVETENRSEKSENPTNFIKRIKYLS